MTNIIQACPSNDDHNYGVFFLITVLKIYKQFEPTGHLIEKENHLNQTSMGSEC